ncbi:MAG: hypothetical protein K2Q10_02855 [Rhodospirillales bacterium]|nr:hypothetical protein [Rhodospirillales bacterium]
MREVIFAMMTAMALVWFVPGVKADEPVPQQIIGEIPTTLADGGLPTHMGWN